jgi:hypothetical protein
VVRNDPQARSLFTNAGCMFKGDATTALFHHMPDGSKFYMTIDHI